MPEDVSSPSTPDSVTEVTPPLEVGCPPPAAQPPREEPDPRVRLHQLAVELTRTRSRRMLIEFLQLRRALR
jgi:hypothetical protein